MPRAYDTFSPPPLSDPPLFPYTSHTHTRSGSAPPLSLLIGLVLLRVLLCIFVIVAIAAHKMSSINGNDFGLYMNRINGELVRYGLWVGRRRWKCGKVDREKKRREGAGARRRYIKRKRYTRSAQGKDCTRETPQL